MSSASATATDLSYKNEKDNHNLSHIPGDTGWPIVGHTFGMVKDYEGTIKKHYEKYGEISRFGLAGFKGVLAIGPDHYQRILLDREKNFSAEMGYSGSLGRFYKGALLLLDHEEHRFQRRLTQGAFKNEAMRGYTDDMAPIVAEAIAKWEHQENFEFFPAIKQLLLDVAAKIFVGLDELDEKAEQLNTAFLDVANGLMAIVTKEIPGGKFKKGKDGERFLHKFFGELIEERRNGDGTDSFSFFTREKTEDGEYFSDEDIIRHMTFLLFAAHDTTTSALSHLVYHLSVNEEWRTKLREEAQAIGKEYLEWDDLEKMPLTDAALKESLRMHPSVQLMQRRTIRECEMGGYTIPANTIIFLSPPFHHMLGDYWTEPTKWDPARFMEPRNEQKNHSFNFIGFGGGGHKCIGMHFALMNAKSFLHQFLTRYDFPKPADYNPGFQNIPLPKPADDLPLDLKRIG